MQHVVVVLCDELIAHGLLGRSGSRRGGSSSSSSSSRLLGLLQARGRSLRSKPISHIDPINQSINQSINQTVRVRACVLVPESGELVDDVLDELAVGELELLLDLGHVACIGAPCSITVRIGIEQLLDGSRHVLASDLGT